MPNGDEVTFPQPTPPQSTGRSFDVTRIIALLLVTAAFTAIGGYVGYWYGTQSVKPQLKTQNQSTPKPATQPPTPPPTSTTSAAPARTRESIKIKVRDPYIYPDKVRVYEYTFTFGRDLGDTTVELLPSSSNDSGFNEGVRLVKASGVALTIEQAFEGHAVSYDKVPEAVEINNSSISDKPFHRVKTSANRYTYVSDYAVGVESCNHLNPTPPACSMSNVVGFNISCTASASQVNECDSAVKDLKVSRVAL
jgi:hypothetical protein